jgi:hypothetical protein
VQSRPGDSPVEQPRGQAEREHRRRGEDGGDADDGRPEQQRGDRCERRHRPLGHEDDGQEHEPLERLERGEAGRDQVVGGEGHAQEGEDRHGLGIAPGQRSDGHGRGDDRCRQRQAQRDDVAEVGPQPAALACHLPRQDPVLAEVRGRGDHGQQRQGERERPEAGVAEAPSHHDPQRDRRELRSDVGDGSVGRVRQDAARPPLHRCVLGAHLSSRGILARG